MKLFIKVKEIKSLSGEMHFERWAVIETKMFSLYCHRIHKADKDHLHSHPWNFVSMILKGSYLEEVEHNGKITFKVKSPLKIAYTHKTWFHKIHSIIKVPVYTLVFVWGGNFEGDKWHYLVGEKKVPFLTYRQIKTEAKKIGKSIEELIKATRLSIDD